MTKDEIALNLKNLRISSGKTQREVAELLGRSQPLIGHWESGYAQPDINMLFALCNIYGTTPDAVFGLKKMDTILSKDDINLLKKYHSLDPQGKKRFNDMLDWEIELIKQLSERTAQIEEQAKYIAELEKAISGNTIEPPTRMVRYYQRLASAGTGNVMWDDLLVDEIEIPDNVKTKDGDFVIGVDGDSMEPLFFNTDMVLVKKADEIEVGEIGVFTLNGECLIKELGHNQLISRNPIYPPILFDDNSDVKCMGKVVCSLMEHSDDEIENLLKRKEYIHEYQKVYHMVAENGLSGDEGTQEFVKKTLKALKEQPDD